jgi:hypothetical protein
VEAVTKASRQGEERTGQVKKWTIYNDTSSFWGIEKGRNGFDWVKIERFQGEVSIDKCGDVWLSPQDARRVARVILAMADAAEKKRKPKPTRNTRSKK